VEANCHFLEFHDLEDGSRSRAYRLVRRANSFARGGIPRSEASLSRTPRMVVGQGKESACPEPVTVPKLNPLASLSGAECQPVAKQVLLYCFRVANCGTFMPLSHVRGEFRIAVVWTRIVAAFSAISSVHFRFCSRARFSLSAVSCR
jgi:hypothetical protein